MYVSKKPYWSIFQNSKIQIHVFESRGLFDWMLHTSYPRISFIFGFQVQQFLAKRSSFQSRRKSIIYSQPSTKRTRKKPLFSSHLVENQASTHFHISFPPLHFPLPQFHSKGRLFNPQSFYPLIIRLSIVHLPSLSSPLLSSLLPPPLPSFLPAGNPNRKKKRERERSGAAEQSKAERQAGRQTDSRMIKSIHYRLRNGVILAA